MKTGQMFIVTMVFLIAMIFSVQQLLIRYTAIDLTTPPQTTDAYLVENIKIAFQSSMDSSNFCSDARKNVREMKNIITKNIKSGYSIDISGELNCTESGDWPGPPELTLYLTLIGPSSETKATFELYR
jgi:hypothetical protein